MKDIKEKSRSYLSFKIGSEIFATHVAYVNNIIEVIDITEVPDVNTYIKGVINLRGAVLPVIDTCSMFKMPPIEFTPLTCILVLEITYKNSPVSVGILVDAVNEVMEIKNDQILPSPVISGFESFNVYIEGIVKHNEKLIMLLNMDKIFNNKSMEGITKQIQTIKELNKV